MDDDDGDLLFDIVPHVEALHLLPNLPHYVSLLLNLVMMNMMMVLIYIDDGNDGYDNDV